ncbi:MAG: S49 family peptidase, partial [Comamonas sp.]
MSAPNTPDNHGSDAPLKGADLWSPAAGPADAQASADQAAGAASGKSGWERDVLEKLVFASLNE